MFSKYKLLLLFLFSFIIGCAGMRPVVIHPIEKSDIFVIERGDKVVKKNGTIIVEKDGWFLSDFYVKEVMKARITK